MHISKLNNCHTTKFLIKDSTTDKEAQDKNKMLKPIGKNEQLLDEIN